MAELLQLAPVTRAELFLAAPKTLQGVFAALGDYYTWRLAQRIFGRESHQAWATLALTVLSPWQWFCSTRTLSNCLETTLTIAVLYNWPWQWSLTERERISYDSAGLRTREDAGPEAVDETTRLRRSLLLAALATVLRPTNLLIWIFLAAMTCLKMSSGGWFARIPWFNQRLLVEFTSPSFLRATSRERNTLIRESILCGSTILILSILVDRWYYGFWTFPPLKFIYFNVVQSLSVFYGRNDWHYYLSQGFPLLLTSALPFAVAGLYPGRFSINTAKPTMTDTILSQLATISCAVPAVLSLISHKEVRFIYPLLPLLHILAARPLVQFFATSIIYPLQSRRTPRYALFRRILLGLLVLINASIAIYTTTIHARGVIDVLSYLRHQHETFYLPHQLHNPNSNPTQNTNLTAAFLTPCHSTPWRSHLIHNSISAWALTCEPPLHLSPTEKHTYIDEADAFYADPLLWLRDNMSRQPPNPRGGAFTGRERQRRHDLQAHRREWPDYLIFFAQAESTMDVALRGSGYAECWRGFNSRWHDDWRRRGDVVVWCLFPERRMQARKYQARSHEEGENGRLGGIGRRVLEWTGKISRSGGTEEHEKGPTALSRDRDENHHHHADNILAGAKGPWGVGKSTNPDKKDHATRFTPTAAARRWWESLWRRGGGEKKKKRRRKKEGVWS
jgi:GPI mannosyltransferase 3